MPEIQPPMYAGGECYTAQQDRSLWSGVICAEGYAGGGSSLQVVDSDIPLGVDVLAGSAFIQGDTVEGQGMYYVQSSSSVPLILEDPDPTDDRIDLIIAKVNDTTYEGSDSDPSTWTIEVVTGAPSPAPIAPSTPDTALTLGTVLVHAGSTTITPGDITDLREPFTFCPGHTGGAIELGAGVSLNSITRPGVYTQGSNNEADSGFFYPPPSLALGGRQAGLLEVFGTPSGALLWQRYTEYHRDFVIWERHRYSGTWTDWFPVGGPGDWTLAAVDASANVTGLGPIPGSSYRGVNRAGRMAVQFNYVGSPLTSDGGGNYPDTLLFTINSESYRPPRDTDIVITRSGITSHWGRVNANGRVYVTHAAFPGAVFGNTTYRIIVDWPPT